MTSILIVDDNLINQKKMKNKLSPFDYDIHTANNGEEAIKFVSENHVNLILMDLHMPIVDGFEATRRLRESYGFTELPIVGLVKEGKQSVIDACFDSGMNDYFVSPYSVDRFEALVQQWLHVVSTSPKVCKADEITISGVNYLDGLKRVLGKKDIYHELLHSYATRDEQILNDLRHERTNENREGIKYYAHALKGVSSNIGAIEVSELCKKLEKELWDGAFDDIDSILNSIEKSYLLIQNDIKDKIIFKEEHEVSQNNIGIYDQLKALLPQLKKGDIKGCKKHITMIKHMEWPSYINNDLETMIEMVKRYHFKEAEQIIVKVLNEK